MNPDKPFHGAWIALTVVLCLLLPTAEISAKKSDKQLAGRIDAILADHYPDEQPGAAAIAVREGKVIYRGAHGMANLELGVPLSAGMVFRLGSITKQFTAAAIMLLEQDGKLSVTDPITKFLPDYPTHGHTITLEHLMTHTSGVKSYTEMQEWMTSRISNPVSVEELVAGFKDEPMDFEPGQRFHYSNSGYVLLGAVIEEVSGQDYETFVQERIFDPLGMTRSYYGSHSRIIPERAAGYDGSEDGPVNARYISMTHPYAAGSLLSTVDDLARWDAALDSGELLTKESYQRMTATFELSDGETSNYGYGFVMDEVRGRPSVRHGGGIFGYVTEGIRIPDEEIYVAVLSNNTGGRVGPSIVAQKIVAEMLGDPYPQLNAVAVDAAILERYVGVYRIDEETTRSLTLEDGRVYTQRTGGSRTEALPASETRFFYPTSLSWFDIVLDDDGQVSGMEMHQNGNNDAELAAWTDEKPTEREKVAVDPEVFDSLVGKYELAPGFVLAITREDDRLMAQATGQPKVRLFASSETEYFLEVVDAQVTFVRSEDGAVDELILHQGGQDRPAKRIE